MQFGPFVGTFDVFEMRMCWKCGCLCEMLLHSLSLARFACIHYVILLLLLLLFASNTGKTVLSVSAHTLAVMVVVRALINVKPTPPFSHTAIEMVHICPIQYLARSPNLKHILPFGKPLLACKWPPFTRIWWDLASIIDGNNIQKTKLKLWRTGATGEIQIHSRIHTWKSLTHSRISFSSSELNINETKRRKIHFVLVSTFSYIPTFLFFFAKIYVCFCLCALHMCHF